MGDELVVGFTFTCDLLKAEEARVRGQQVRHVEGLASLETPDLEHETVIQKGMDFAPFLATGHINWDHGVVRRGSPAYIIGEPTDAKIIKHRGHDAFWVEGFLYNDPENKPVAEDVWRHAQTLKGAQSGRKLAWSVEGQTRLRSGGEIRKSTIYHLALTHAPVHGETFANFAEVMKSLQLVSALGEPDLTVAAILKAAETAGLNVATMDSLEALRKEDLKKPRHRPPKAGAKEAVQALWGDDLCKSRCFDVNGHFHEGTSGALKHLVQCQGWPVEHAEQYLKSLRNAF